MKESTPMTHMGQSAGAYAGVKPSSSRTAQGVAAAGQGRRIERIADVSEIERALELAAVTLKPDELSARQLINRLMPNLYTLRKKGFSYAQMTRVLNQAICGSSPQLQTATVKAYYNEFIVERLDDCERKLKAALEATAEVEKITKSAPKKLIAEAVALKNALAPKRSNATERLLNRQARPEAGPVGGGNGSNAKQIPQPETVAIPVENASPAPGTKPPSAAGQDLVCTTSPTPDNVHASLTEMFDGIALEFFSSFPLEHPSIPGLMLSKEQRMCKERLKYTADGAAKLESVPQMFNRLKWKKPERQTVSRTQNDFVLMDSGLFKKSE